MSFVVHIGTTQNGVLVPLVSVRLAGGQVSLSGDETLIEELKLGIVDKNGQRVTLEQKYQYLLAISQTFDHPSLIASEVIEKN